MRIAWIAWKEKIQQSYWFVPALMTGGAVFLAYMTLRFGNEFSETFKSVPWILSRDPQGARDLLAMVGGSLITVTGVVFSVTLVALTNASAQYGTRILTTFARDLGNKVVLGTFVGTFLYCILIMRTITRNDGGYVPHFAVFIGVVLSMFAFAVLIYFIHHLVEILQSENVISALVTDLQETIRRMYPERFGKPVEQGHVSLPDRFEELSAGVVVNTAGYVQAIDAEMVMDMACKSDLLIRIEKRPGDFVVPGMRVASVFPRTRSTEKIEQSLCNAFRTGKKRTYAQDMAFGFEQLQLVAIRALSPAMNNQILGMGCIDRILEGLVYLGTRGIPSQYRMDEQHRLRVVASAISYSEAVQLALNMVIEAAQSNPSTAGYALRRMNEMWTQFQVPEMRVAIFRAAERLKNGALECAQSSGDCAQVTEAFAQLATKNASVLAA